MKIIQLTTYFHPVVGGVEEHVLSVSKVLAATEYDVEVWCSDSNKHSGRIAEKISQFAAKIKIVRFRYWFDIGKYYKFFPGVIWSLLIDSYTMVHVHGHRTPEFYLASIICWLRGKKIILTTHYPFQTFIQSTIKRAFIKFVDATLGKFAISRVHKVIVSLNQEKKQFVQSFGISEARIIKLNRGISSDFFAQGDSAEFYKKWEIAKQDDELLVAAHGTVDELKGYQYMVTAAKKLKKVKFFIAGNGKYLPHLEKLFENNKNVFFAKRYIQREDLIDLLEAADLYVMPCVAESYGMAVLEAQAMGLPVVTTDVAGIRELVDEKSAIMVKPADEYDLYLAIKDLVNDPTRRAKMAEQARILAKKQSFESVGKKLISIYSELKQI